MYTQFYFTFVVLILQILVRTSEGVATVDEYFPPKFVQPCTPQHIKKTYHTSNSVVISWSKPNATDLNGDQPRVEQVVGPSSGRKFNGTIFGEDYMIVYVATDKDGLKDSCSFSFTVIVSSCKNLDVVERGQYACTDGTKNGSSCVLSCHEGYKATGIHNTTCEGPLPAWKTVQTCEIIQCSDPVVPVNGSLSCTNNIFEYQTVCKTQCLQGFVAVGPSYLKCMANGKWSKNTQCIRQESEQGQCSSTVCNGHTCLINPDGFTSCKCSYGWTGKACEIPPDFCENNICENNATCRSIINRYLCVCQPDYYGSLCHITPVNGNWSDWTLWSRCSVSCNTGLRTRHRSCNNPPPDIYGSICYGNTSEIADCHEEDCKECPELERVNDQLAFFKCEMDNVTKLETCSVSCPNGTVHTPWFEEFETLRCGRETGYMWIPGSILLDPCFIPVIPERILFDTEMMFNSKVSIEQRPDCKSKILQNVKEKFCDKSSHCKLTTQLQSEPVADEVQTLLNILLDWYLNYISNSDEGTEELTISDIEAMAENLKQFTLKVSDINSECNEFHANKSSLKQTENVTCTAGYVPFNEVCVKCPAGTYTKDSRCFLCRKGKYQERTGQTSCLSCPDGYTTTNAGSTHVIQCQVYHVEDDELKSGLEKGSYIAAIVSPIVAILVAIITSTACCKICKSRQRKKEEQTSSDQEMRFPYSSDQKPTSSYRSDDQESSYWSWFLNMIWGKN